MKTKKPYDPNTARVKNAREALTKYREGDPHDKQANVIDLLTDLRHYCDAHNLDFTACDLIAQGHHTEETRKEQNT